jgi:putative addiction module component (TIGR02574 family)
MSTSQLPNSIRLLPIADRVRLAEEIWNSVVEDEREFELAPQQLKMLRERVSAHRKDPGSGMDWTAFKTEIQGE